ncbi:MAG: acyl-CoA thioesterase [Bacteroidales bacterium]|nr:acyl-CoA thioesterase [Bacteroidales bacterium]
MNSFQTIYRVSYSDTDQMGYMHHSNYFKCYETSRWELFRSIGIPYTKIEEEGIIFPVINASVKFIKPAFYDQEITVKTQIRSFKGARIVFEYQALNETGELINEAQITVAFVRKNTGKACFPSKRISDTLKGITDK